MISRIIEDLSDVNQSLVNPLLKTKILASRIGNQKLLDWVNRELNGYPSDEVPSYRTVPASSQCNLHQSNGYIEYNTPVPVIHIKDDNLRNFFMEFPLTQSVKTLESLIDEAKRGDGKKDQIGKLLPIDFWAFFTQEMKKVGFNCKFTHISVGTAIHNITQSLTEIRNNLLDLLLRLEHEFPELESKSFSTVEEKQQVNEIINYFMTVNNINNSGSGSTINTGDSNKINNASGDHNNQEIISPEVKSQLESTVQEIKELLEKKILNKEAEEEIELEVLRIENQLKKVSPKKGILKQSFETIKSIVIATVANALTDPLVDTLSNTLLLFA